MGEKLRLGAGKRNNTSKKNRQLTFSEEKIDTKVRRYNRYQLQAKKERLQDMDIEDLRQYIYENSY
ncbi:MAG: hypothetical protein JXA92_05070 [candidate division Zixibacteria bacterium]|nr:hypothetical protein [candidate division Zixibacteria bacterium]